MSGFAPIYARVSALVEGTTAWDALDHLVGRELVEVADELGIVDLLAQGDLINLGVMLRAYLTRASQLGQTGTRLYSEGLSYFRELSFREFRTLLEDEIKQDADLLEDPLRYVGQSARLIGRMQAKARIEVYSAVLREFLEMGKAILDSVLEKASFYHAKLGALSNESDPSLDLIVRYEAYHFAWNWVATQLRNLDNPWWEQSV